MQGLPSGRAKGKIILSATNGVVIAVGRETRKRYRGKRICILVRCEDDVTLEYCRVGGTLVKVGDTVKHGDEIALVGTSPLMLEARRNGRLIDIESYLGIPQGKDTFTFCTEDYLAFAANVLEFTEQETRALLTIPHSETIGKKMYDFIFKSNGGFF